MWIRKNASSLLQLRKSGHKQIDDVVPLWNPIYWDRQMLTMKARKSWRVCCHEDLDEHVKDSKGKPAGMWLGPTWLQRKEGHSDIWDRVEDTSY